MTHSIGIAGFGRMGRLALRAIATRPELGLEVALIHECAADVEALAVLLEFDSVQGHFSQPCSVEGGDLRVGERVIGYRTAAADDVPDWGAAGVDLVLECTGTRRDPDALGIHRSRGADRVVVSAPVKGAVPNVVVGVNHDAFDLASAELASAASCTTNCLAPVVRVVHDALGIERGLVTTIHDPTNTQRVVDAPHADPRRARAAGINLIPTSTNSAHAVTRIVPELAGKLDSIAVRAPVHNASLVDAVFQLGRATDVEELNGLFEEAARTERLRGVLGVERRPLVSSDFARDPRSAIVDARSTRVTDGSLVKVLAWYDNEWGYVNRMVELAALVLGADRSALHGADVR